MKKVELVKEAINKLPDKYKNVMILRELENKTYLDIADICTKDTDINIDDDILNLSNVSDFLSIQLNNNSDELGYINKYRTLDNKKETIQFKIAPYGGFYIDREDISDVINIEIMSFGKMTGVYKVTTNLSTIKSQISKGRQLIQSMVLKKFKILDEQGIY